jgi:hypothetical protein
MQSKISESGTDVEKWLDILLKIHLMVFSDGLHLGSERTEKPQRWFQLFNPPKYRDTSAVKWVTENYMGIEGQWYKV